MILKAELPSALWAEIEAAYARLGVESTAAGAVAVRCSATAEDLPTASFAGQQETFLNVRGLAALRQAIGVLVFKPTLQTGKRPILRRRVGAKHLRMVYGASGSGSRTCNEPVPEPERRRLCLSDEEALTLARWALRIEDYYTQRAARMG